MRERLSFYLERESPIHSMNPFTKLVMVFTLIILAFLVPIFWLPTILFLFVIIPLSFAGKVQREFINAVARLLLPVVGFIFVMQLLAVFWLIMPAFYPQGFHLHWLDLVTPVGIGGLWLAFFVWQLKKKSLLPLHDPRFQGVPAHD